MALPDQRSGAHSLNRIQDLGVCHCLGRLVLLLRIVRAESSIRRARKQNAQTKSELSKRGNTRDTSTGLRKTLHRRRDYIEAQKTLIATLRSIGDAVAFVFGDRHQ